YYQYICLSINCCEVILPFSPICVAYMQIAYCCYSYASFVFCFHTYILYRLYGICLIVPCLDIYLILRLVNEWPLAYPFKRGRQFILLFSPAQQVEKQPIRYNTAVFGRIYKLKNQ